MEPGNSLRVLRCTVGGQSYCLDLATVQSIQRHELMEPDASGGGCVGRLTTQGQRIPIHDLGARLGATPAGQVASGPILVFQSEASLFGLTVDELAGIVDVTADRVDPVPSFALDAGRGFFKGVVRVGDELVLYLDSQRLHPDTPLPPPRSAPRSPAAKPKPANTSAPAGGGKILVFTINSAKATPSSTAFGLSITQVLEVLDMPEVTTVPAAPAHVSGLVNWREQPVPVIDLGERLGLGKPTSTHKNRLLIVQTPDGLPVGFPIRPATEVLVVPKARRLAAENLPFDSGYARGVFEIRGRTLVVPDVEAVARGN